MIDHELEESIVKILKECIEDDDNEMAHINADEALLKLLNFIGYKKVVKYYKKINKWYA